MLNFADLITIGVSLRYFRAHRVHRVLALRALVFVMKAYRINIQQTATQIHQ